MSAVACPAAGDCVAVGNYIAAAGRSQPLIERWNGTAWTKQASPTDPGGFLSGISCPSTTSCFAVGYTLSTSNVYQPLFEIWNGTAWMVQTSPSHPGGLLSGVTCLSAKDCVAVGDTSTGPGGTATTLAETWNGAAWKVQTTPNKSGDSDYFNAVACASAASCVAVGGYFDSTPTGAPFSAIWNGHSWTTKSVPTPKGTTLGYFNGAACPSATECLAVGAAEINTTLTYVAEDWNGTAWKIQTTANPGHSSGNLNAISCTSAKACTTVGTGGSLQALAEGWNGTAWSATNPPSRSDQPAFDGVACTAPSACTAVGNTYTVSTGATHTLAEAEQPGT